jgi:hypothetical protein
VKRIGRPSPGLRARPGTSIAKQSEGRAGEKYLPVGGWVKKLRAVEDQSAPIPEEITSELGRIISDLKKRLPVPFLFPAHSLITNGMVTVLVSHH